MGVAEAVHNTGTGVIPVSYAVAK